MYDPPPPRIHERGGKVLKKLFVALAVVASFAALTTAPSADAVTYGTATGESYPYVGGLVTTSSRTGEQYVYCTGTLISSTVFLTAAHCDLGTGTACVTFDPRLTDSSKLYCGTFTASPLYTHRQNDPNDIAVVVFDRPIRGIEPATVVSEVGYLDALQASGELNQSTEFISVGYGGTEFTNAPGGPTAQYFDTRMYATGTFNALGPGYIRISQNPATGDAGTCYGDSGGPQFLDGVVVSITVTGDVLCKSTNVVQRLDTADAQAFLSEYV
jgi:secreted trypsin-like serine protease